ncbi:MAG TPA: hypothetical protein VM934_15005 [Pyrinomonadaceae bacterium]|nr:hypothetical protein [Pyrinomonadaceae bacterium]
MNAKTEEASLILRLYETRREKKFRKARLWYAVEFNPQSAQDIIDLMRSGHPQSAAYRMVTTYWEMAAAFVNAGAIDAQLFHAANTEHMVTFAKLEPFIDEVRAAFGLPQYLGELEKLATGAPNAKEFFEKMRGLLKHWGEVYQRGEKSGRINPRKRLIEESGSSATST